MSVIKKVSIVLLVLMIFTFFVPNIVRAEGDGIGGRMLKPVMSLVMGIGDSAMTLLQKVVFNIPDSLINIDSGSSFWAKFWVGLGIFLGVAAGIALCLIPGLQTGGIALLAGAGKALLVLIGSLIFAPMVFSATTPIVEGMLPDSFQLPLFSVSPKEIFSKDVHLLDVDFFNPMEDEEAINTREPITKEIYIFYEIVDENLTLGNSKITFSFLGKNYEVTTATKSEIPDDDERFNSVILSSIINDYRDKQGYRNYFEYNPTIDISQIEKYHFKGSNGVYYLFTKTTNMTGYNTYEYYEIEGYNTEKIQSTAKILKSTISKWYNILRNLAIVALLSILVYVGIRIVISSTSNDKAKYKQMIIDWIVAICLIFIMQYIMSFANIMNDRIIDIVKSVTANNENDIEDIMKDKKITKEKAERLKADGYEMFVISDPAKVKKAYEALITNSTVLGDNIYVNYFKDTNGNPATSAENASVLYWPAYNEISQARVKAQLCFKDQTTWESIGWKLIYVILVIFTFIFLFTYVKRVLYMAFLTVIAPFVAMTYPIDKIHDGKAQAFNMWLKEYIFNLLIQPMHLILYTVLIGSAMDLAAKNIIYVACALGFMMPAEKLMRKFFGFEKAQTPGLLAGAAGAGLMMSGMNKLLSKAPNEKGGSSDNSKDDESEDSQYKPRKNIFEDMNGELNNNGQGVDLQENQDENVTPEGNEGGDLQDNSVENQPESQDGEDDDPPIIPEQEEEEEEEEEERQDENQRQQRNNQRRQNQQQIPMEKSVLRGVSRAGEQYFKGLGKKFVKKANNTHLHLGRKAAGLALGLTAGTAGAILGVATGDASNVFKYAAGAGLAGNKAGKGIGSRVGNALSVEGTVKTFDEQYLGSEEYKERQQKKLVEKKKNDEKLKWELEDKLQNKDDAYDFIEQIPQIMEYGDFDNDTLVAMSQMWRDNGKNQTSLNNAIYAAGLSQHYFDSKSYELSGDKKKSEFEKDIKRIGEQRAPEGTNLDDYCNERIRLVQLLDSYKQ